MSVTSEITNMQNQSAAYKLAQEKSAGTTRNPSTENSSNMFLTLMLEQLQHQDPTQPTDNTEWMSQLAQYSSLEQMTQMNEGLSKCMNYMSSMYNDMCTNSEITQTLSLIGKDVTIKDPEDPAGANTITGVVTEASFEDGTGRVKVGDNFYSIMNIVSVRDKTNEVAENI